MKTFLVVMLCASTAGANDRLWFDNLGRDEARPADAPVADDVPGTSVKLNAGEPAPFDGRLLSLVENTARGKAAAECKGELEAAKTGNVLLPRGAMVAIIVGAVLASAAITAGVTVAALKAQAPPAPP